MTISNRSISVLQREGSNEMVRRQFDKDDVVAGDSIKVNV